MSNWRDVRTYMETGEGIKSIPEGMEVYPVVGVSFVPGYPNNIHNIRIAMATLEEEIPVNLVRNPDNKYDSNAIEVRSLGGMLGHLPREVAAQLAPLIDAGKKYKATIYQVRVSPENSANPGMDILIGEEKCIT